MQCGEFMVSGGDQLHEVLPHHIRIFPVQGTLHIGVDHALSCHFFSDIMIYQFGIVLGTHTGQRLPLCLRDSQLLKGILDILRHLGPFGAHMGIGLDIGHNIVHVQALDRRPPVRNLHLIIDLQRLQTEIRHPCGIVLLRGDLFHNGGRQSFLNAVDVFFFITDIVNTSVDVLHISLFSFTHSDRRPPLRFQKTFKTMLVDLIYERSVAGCYNLAVHQNMGLVHMQGL